MPDDNAWRERMVRTEARVDDHDRQLDELRGDIELLGTDTRKRFERVTEAAITMTVTSAQTAERMAALEARLTKIDEGLDSRLEAAAVAAHNKRIAARVTSSTGVVVSIVAGVTIIVVAAIVITVGHLHS